MEWMRGACEMVYPQSFKLVKRKFMLLKGVACQRETGADELIHDRWVGRVAVGPTA